MPSKQAERVAIKPGRLSRCVAIGRLADRRGIAFSTVRNLSVAIYAAVVVTVTFFWNVPTLHRGDGSSVHLSGAIAKRGRQVLPWHSISAFVLPV